MWSFATQGQKADAHAHHLHGAQPTGWKEGPASDVVTLLQPLSAPPRLRAVGSSWTTYTSQAM